MKKKVICILAALAFLMPLTSCGVLDKVRSKIENKGTTTTEVVQSTQAIPTSSYVTVDSK